MALLGMEFEENPSIVDGVSNVGDGVSVPTGTLTIVNSITFTKGTWLVNAKCDWQSNANGVRQISYQNAMNPGRNQANTTPGFSGGKECYQEMTHIITFTTSETYNLYCFQNSGVSLMAYAFIRAYKLNDN